MSATALDSQGRERRKLVLAVSVGAALEWFDFTLFAIFALQIAVAFFPASDPLMSLLASYLALAVGFVARPLGALLMGRYADRRGRTTALTLSIMLMGAGTLIMAVCPTYEAIGWWAPLSIVVARILQGVAAGGEIGGALAYLVETAPANRPGLFASSQQVAQAVSFLLCGVSASLLSGVLTPAQLDEWGWRVPYVFGLLVVVAGLKIRRSLEESEPLRRFLDNQDKHAMARKGPSLRPYLPNLVMGVLIVVLWTVATQLINFMPTYASMVLELPRNKAYLGLVLVGLITLLCPLTALLSDRIGRYTVMLIGAVGIALCAYPGFVWLNNNPSLQALISFQCGLAVLMVLYTGPASAALAELFPVQVRALGVSLAYALSVTIFGSSTPTLTTLIYRQSGDPLAAAHWLFTAACLSATPLAWMCLSKSRASSSMRIAIQRKYE
ncbi:Proline/glycine betaine transporter major facilitator super protein [Pseudomonas savastanoi]|uniref:Proline/glycine betaine transporter major facilitator super protein n=1 Tax=Pseudomonas savastanoi TaxID=29438 RepID=A0A3M5GQK7_PSESS|nr:Proline/glycine betaine transporter major facilitator super protein [Pseudomonas savastanoi]